MKTFLWLTGWATGLLVLILLITALAVNQSRRQLEAYRAALEKRGESFDIAQLRPPTPPKEGNGAAEFLTAARDLQKAAQAEELPLFQIKNETAPGRNTVQHRAPNASRGQKDVSWSKVREQVARFEPWLAKIHKATSSPHLEIQPEYEKGFHAEIVGALEALKASQILAQQGLVFLQEGNVSGAAKNLRAILRLSEMTQKQQTLISRALTASQITIAQILTWEILQSPTLTEATLMLMQDDWNRVAPTAESLKVLRIEQTTGLPFFQSASYGDYTKARVFNSLDSSPLHSVPRPFHNLVNFAGFARWSTLHRHTDAKVFLTNFQTLLDHVPTDESSGPWSDFLAELEQLESQLNRPRFNPLFSRTMLPFMKLSFSRIVGAQATVHLSQTAIALQRYQLSRGQYPESLADLVPAWLPAVPFDPFDARPLRYQRLANGKYLLYSIGPNGTDENGDATKSGGSRRKGFLDGNDLVWPRVAPTP